MRWPPYPLLWLRCWLAHGGHRPYTHRHAGEPDATYCLRCRITIDEPEGGR